MTATASGSSSLVAVLKPMNPSRCRHAYRVDCWFRGRQRQNSLSCSARTPPWWKPARAAGGRVDRSIRLLPNALRELLSGRIVSTLLPRARSSSTCAARCMPHSNGVRVCEWPPVLLRLRGTTRGLVPHNPVPSADRSAAISSRAANLNSQVRCFGRPCPPRPALLLPASVMDLYGPRLTSVLPRHPTRCHSDR